jgi:1-acyl-sn-glycerol-3-phosphate acyltransferase
MEVPPLWARRLVVLPLVVVVEGILLAASPLIVVLAALASPLFGGLRPVRLAAIVLVLTARHLAALCGCLQLWLRGRAGDLGAHYALLESFVGELYRIIVRAARVEVRVEDPDGVEALLSDSRRPAIVLYRHAGEGDSLLAVQQLACRYGRRPRLVMHEALRWDPLIDVLGTRLPNRFLDPRGGDTERDIARMSSDLGPRDAVLIFPEGGNVTPERRRRSIERLVRAGHAEQAAAAQRMTHVSAPRPGGALAAIGAAPDADVVLIGHRGMPTGFKELWELLPDRQRVDVRLWHVAAADVPPDRHAQIDWLFDWWATMDAWIDGRADAP